MKPKRIELRAEQATLDRIQRAAKLVHEQTFDKLMSSLDAADQAPRLAAAARKPAAFTQH